MEDRQLIYKVKEFSTPYTALPEIRSKYYRLKKVRYTRGLYRMENVYGYRYFYVEKPITVTILEYKEGKEWSTLMVDDPMHWFGMRELSELVKPSKVLVAGLGMGLILHHLVKREDVRKIKVVEIDEELVKFIKPYLPDDKRIGIEIKDYYGYLHEHLLGHRKREDFNSVIIDLWVLGEEDTEMKRKHIAICMDATRKLTKACFPNAKILLWGVRGYGMS